MIRLRYLLTALGIIAGFGTALLCTPNVAAVGLNYNLTNRDKEACSNAADNGQDGCESVTTSGQGVTANTIVKGGINLALAILGSVSVVMMVYAGFRFALANGDPAAVTAARNTILYAVAGLVIAVLSYAIVNWIVDYLL